MSLKGAYVTGGHNWMVLDGSQSQIYQIQPPDFFPIGPSFQRYITVKFRQAAPSSDYFGHLCLLKKMARKGG